MTLSPRSIIESVLRWLRAGYPDGIPQQDYVALFAVLHRRLTPIEIEQVVERLTAGHDQHTPIERCDIESAITALAKEQPGDEDIARVAARLAAGGWPPAPELRAG